MLNRQDNVYPVNLALDNTECEKTNPDLDFWKSQNVGGFSIDDKIRKNFEKLVKEKKTTLNIENGYHCKVEQRTLESFDIKFEINFIEVAIEEIKLKLFVEGFETIKKQKIPPILFELWEDKDWYKDKADKTKQMLNNWWCGFNHFGREILAKLLSTSYNMK